MNEMTFRHPPPWAQSGGNYARALREQNLNIDTSPDARSPEEPHLRPDHPPLPHRADSFYSASLSAPKDHKETHPTVHVGTTPTSPSEPEQTLATFEIHVHEEESSTYIPPTPDEQKRMWYAEHLGMV